MRRSSKLAAGCIALLSGCSAVWGPLYEPHVQTRPGTAVLYIYQLYDPTDPLEGTGGRTAVIAGECSILLNDKAIARCADRTYSVVEVQPGRVDFDVMSAGRSVSTVPKLGFRVEPDETYYVWVHFSPPPGRSMPHIEFVLRQEQERVAVERLRRLRKQDTL